MSRFLRLMGLIAGLCIAGCTPRTAAPALSSSGSEEVWADAYSTDASAGGMQGDAADESLRSALVEGCQRAQLVPDGRLSELAEALALQVRGNGHAPDAALVSYHAHRLGLLEPTPQLWVGNGGGSAAIVPALREAIAAAGPGVTHCGGAAVRGGYGVVVVLSFVRRLVALATPIPRHLARGESLALRGRLADGFVHPTLAMTAPEGKVERVELGPGSEIERDVTFASAGEYTLELLANGAEGVTVAAVFPVAVGVPLSRSRPPASRDSAERDPEQVAEKLVQLIARERKQRDLPALAPHAGLSQVSLAHSRDMREHHFVAHTSKLTGEASDRLHAAGLRATLLLENIGRGYSADEIHAGLMESPGHRGNILHGDVRSLGVGVVAEPEGDRVAFLATQLFARLAEPVNWARAQEDLFSAISRARAQQKLPKAQLDAALSRVAQAAAERYARRPGAGDQAALDEAVQSVRSLPAGARQLGAALIKAEDLPQVAGSTELLDPKLTALGLGVAALPEGQTYALAVVLLLALRQ